MDYRRLLLRWIPVVNIVRDMRYMACLHGWFRVHIKGMPPLHYVYLDWLDRSSVTDSDN